MTDQPLRIRLVDLDDDTHVLEAQLLKRRGNIVTVKYVYSSGRPFRPEQSWTRRFDKQTGLDVGEQAGFKVHPDDVGLLQ